MNKTAFVERRVNNSRVDFKHKSQRRAKMSQMLNLDKELIRICPNNSQKLEYSTNDGRTWSQRYSGSSYGDFEDLTDNGKEILATTSKGLYYSTNAGRTWSKRS
jgi:hypothetical protein